MEPFHLEEYRQLRATIRARGSLRAVLFVVTIAAWALAVTLVAASIALPLASLVSLILLMAGFEAVHQLHVGVERIGRYLYVRYESDGAGGNAGSANHSRLMWEGAARVFADGHRPPTQPADALFSLVFAGAVLINFLSSTLGATAAELAGIGAIHALALVRIVTARRAAGRQRAEDQRRFEAIL